MSTLLPLLAFVIRFGIKNVQRSCIFHKRRSYKDICEQQVNINFYKESSFSQTRQADWYEILFYNQERSSTQVHKISWASGKYLHHTSQVQVFRQVFIYIMKLHLMNEIN